MFGAARTNNVVVNYNIDTVYDALLRAIPTISGFKVKDESRMAHRISVGIGASLFSWGELMAISLSEVGENKTGIEFSSQSKLGTEIAANSKNQKNIDNIIKALERTLQ
jgi:hypothetical protein